MAPSPWRSHCPAGVTLSVRRDPTSLVDLRDVTFAYPGREPVLEDLSFRLRAGEIVAILGR